MKQLILASIAVIGMAGASSAQDLVADGEKVFNKCKACHAVGEGAKNRVGPMLNDVFGRQAGTVDGFRYSNVMVALGEAGLNWDDETMAGYFGNPRKWLVDIAPEYGLDCADLQRCRGKMVFAGLKKPEEIEAVLAYLRTFSAEQPES